MRITTWDQNGIVLKDAETPTLNEQARYVRQISTHEKMHKITTRIIYYAPPSEDDAEKPKEVITWTYSDDKPPVENKKADGLKSMTVGFILPITAFDMDILPVFQESSSPLCFRFERRM